jgi:DNA polymerase-1
MPKDVKIVYLIDGSSYVHRAYHAIRGLTDSKGFPTNAILGFTKMFLKLLSEKNPEYLAVVFDSKGPTFRHKIYEAYKANRPPMPDDMASQIPVIKRILEDLSVKILEKQGYEADDIIGTLARLSQEQGFQVVMVTGDKDFRQLITPQNSIWDSMKDVVISYGSLKEAYGFEPEKFVDVMGLSGDSVDNIPGVPGVGEKTATDLIRQFGSLENVFDHLEDISRLKLKENLSSSRDLALLSKRLVTIEQRVPIDEDIGQLKVEEPKRENLAQTFRELEFRGLWEQFTSRQEGLNDYRLCLSEEFLRSVLDRIRTKGMVCVDTETTSQDPFRAELVGISFSCEEDRAFYLPIAHQYLGAPSQMGWPQARNLLKGILEDDRIAKVGQNIKYDAEVLKRHGVELKGIAFDTMIASYILNPGLRQHNLDYLAQHYLNHKMLRYHDVVGKGRNALNFSEVDIEKAKAYSCEDADVTLKLMGILDQKLRLDKNEDLFYNMEMKLLPVLMDMEMTGIKIDPEFFREMSARFAEQMKEIECEIYEEAGMEFNINSSQQLGEVLFKKLMLPVQKKTAKTKKYSTDVKVLKRLAAYSYRIPSLILRYRTISKLKTTYLDALIKMLHPDTGRIHTSYNQTVTATGRLSSSNPNLQNIPIRGEEGREIRKGFVAEDGCYLVSADYSQIELRVFAHYSRDDAFIESFSRDEDIHTRTASEILGVDPLQITGEMRRLAKAINFGIIYGMGPRKLSEEMEIDFKTAKAYIDAYYDRYKGVARYRDEMIQEAKKQGYVSTLFGRRRYLPDINHGNRVIQAEAERMAVNTPIQGTAADLIKTAMIHIYDQLCKDGLRSKMLLQVHDELVLEVPEKELDAVIPMIREKMEGVYLLSVPLKVDIGKGQNWDEAH